MLILVHHPIISVRDWPGRVVEIVLVQLLKLLVLSSRLLEPWQPGQVVVFAAGAWRDW